ESKSSGGGPLKLLDVEELLELDFGSWFGRMYENEKIMTFNEVLELAKGRIQVYADLRDADPKQLVRDLQEEDMVNQVVILADEKSLASVRAIQSGVRVMPRLKQLEAFEGLQDLRPYAVEVAWALVSPELIQQSHHSGVKVFANATTRDERADAAG